MKVSAVMTRGPITVTSQHSLEQALDLMDRNDFRHLPVVDEGRLLGIVSERDLLEGLGRMPGAPSTSERRVGDRPGSVGEIAHRNVRSVSPGTPLDAVASVLVGLGIGCLPVLEGDKLTGIVTEMDVLAHFRDSCRSGLLPAVADPEVATRMSRTLIHVGPDTSLADACTACSSRRVRHLPVLDRGLLVGIVSDRDLRPAATSAHPASIRVADIMATEVETIGPHERLSTAADRMVDLKITCLPVLRGDEVVGMLSSSDILAHCSDALVPL